MIALVRPTPGSYPKNSHLRSYSSCPLLLSITYAPTTISGHSKIMFLPGVEARLDHERLEKGQRACEAGTLSSPWAWSIGKLTWRTRRDMDLGSLDSSISVCFFSVGLSIFRNSSALSCPGWFVPYTGTFILVLDLFDRTLHTDHPWRIRWCLVPWISSLKQPSEYKRAAVTSRDNTIVPYVHLSIKCMT